MGGQIFLLGILLGIRNEKRRLISRSVNIKKYEESEKNLMHQLRTMKKGLSKLEFELGRERKTSSMSAKKLQALLKLSKKIEKEIINKKEKEINPLIRSSLDLEKKITYSHKTKC